MPDDAGSVPPSATFTVDFNAYVAGHYNRDLGGKGTLVIRADEPRFVFTGRPRKSLFFAKHSADLAFRSDQIWNVTVHDRGVSFATAVGKSGAKQTPFVFTFGSEADALAAAAQLPETKDAEFKAGADFSSRLSQLPGATLSSVTIFLILANIAAFIALGLAGAGWFEVKSMMPYILYGANNGAATTAGEWWRLVSCMFLHFGLIHLLLNLWALFQAGLLVEKLLGRVLYTVVYFGSGLVGSLATLHWNGDKVWSAGASGAVFGVYGALLGYLVREKQAVPRSVFQPLLKSTLVFAGYNLVYGAVHPNIDNAAHLGGLLGGFVLGWACALPLDLAARARLFRPRLLAGLVIVVLALAIGISTAPRYDYRVRDELAWREANESFIAREKPLVDGRDALFVDYQRTHQPDALLRWLDEVAPFYEQWHEAVIRLPLAPGLPTTIHRDRFSAILAQKAAAYRHLASALRSGDSSALERFHIENRATIDAIQALAAEKRDRRETPR